MKKTRSLHKINTRCILYQVQVMIHFRLDLMGNKTCPAKPLLCRNSKNRLSEIVNEPLSGKFKGWLGFWTKFKTIWKVFTLSITGGFTLALAKEPHPQRNVLWQARCRFVIWSSKNKSCIHRKNDSKSWKLNERWSWEFPSFILCTRLRYLDFVWMRKHFSLLRNNLSCNNSPRS